uniref:Protein translocase subunit SecY n=1 Tax=Rhizochromulina marina TaxID=1034831 RepID=A0A514CPU4_9STRA|nr:preprotein translocase subunit SecY [Rhizochromulina marina]QDH81825.1 preprotein translocase subunit SecY [Rhizochromulina marina]
MIQTKNSLVQKIQITLLIIFILRLGTFIPVPHVDQRYLNNNLNSSLLFQILNNTDNPRLGVFSLGIIPYINASIVIQLLTGIIPKFEKLQKEEGENGRKQLKQYTRILTLIFALQQSISIALSTRATIFNWNLEICGDIILALTTGTMLVLWLSERISEQGIGNGPSIVIATSIISSLPTQLDTLTNFAIKNVIQMLAFIVLISGIVFVQEAIRRIPLISAKQLFSQQTDTRLNRTYLPLRINQGGVMPIIFASAVISFLASGSRYLNQITFFNNLNHELLITLFTICKFGLILGFTFFYSTLILNPKEMAKDLNKMAVTIPQVRPGIQTEQFLSQTLKRLGTLGALFLALLVSIPNFRTTSSIGITSFLILVSVIVETDRQILTLLINKTYDNSID